MKYTNLGRFGVLFLALIMVVGAIPLSAQAATPAMNVTWSVPDGAKTLATQDGSTFIQLWHYSGGYWGVNTSDPLRIYDSEIKGNLEKLADMTGRSIKFTYNIPPTVTTAINSGKKIGICIGVPSSYDYFGTSRGAPLATIDNGKLTVEAYPKFHLLSMDEASFDDFVSGLRKRIPLVDPKYGRNVYSIFSTSNKSLGAAKGYFDPSYPFQVGPTGTIHPSQIVSNQGALQSGFTVTVGGIDYPSSNVKIGNNTFRNAGAVGIHFDYNLTITYYEISDTDVAVTAITPTVFDPSQPSSAVVTVTNPGTKDVTAPVAFTIPGITSQRTDVTLKAKETKTLTFAFTSPASGTFPMTAEINPDRTFDEATFENNKLTVTGQVRLPDVAVTAITPTVFDSSEPSGVQVTVKNLGVKPITTPVRFNIPGITDQRKDVALNAGESKTLTFSFTSPASGTFPMTANINPDRSFTESTFANNSLTVTGQVRNNTDVAVTKIEKTSYPATSVVTADVSVKNLGTKSITTPVEFSVPGLTTQTQHVTLAAGQTLVLHYKFSTPPSGTLSMTAEANKGRTFTESNYSNNRMTVSAAIIPAPTGSASCSDTITWTENDSHWVPDGFWYDGDYYDTSYTCHHTFTYETKLTASYNITPTNLKSGYGFAVTVNNSISTRMVSNSGCGWWGNSRANTQIPTTPDRAQVKLGWTVKNTRGTQPSTIDLNLISRTSTQSRFEPRQNPISETGAKLLYTDVALAGTKASPKQHQLIISITGGGVNGIPFCKEFTDRITINGNMYEDDHSGHS